MSELIRMRSILIGNIQEKDKNIRKHARKYYMTDEIKEYLKEKNKENQLQKIKTILDVGSDFALKNRERRLKKGVYNG